MKRDRNSYLKENINTNKHFKPYSTIYSELSEKLTYYVPKDSDIAILDYYHNDLCSKLLNEYNIYVTRNDKIEKNSHRITVDEYDNILKNKFNLIVYQPLYNKFYLVLLMKKKKENILREMILIIF